MSVSVLEEKILVCESLADFYQFAIGERAILIRTPVGNVLWDLIPFLDQETVDKIVEMGGLKAIVISHPHYYSTWSDWSRTFACPVYVGAPDTIWLERVDSPGAELRPLKDLYTPILPGSGITAIVAGGHFDGSALLHWEGTLFIADTIFTSRSGMNPVPGKPGVTSFSFFWSIPNYIPMHPDAVHTIWKQVKPFDFHTAFGAFESQDVRTMENEHERGTGGVKGRLLQSCQIYIGGQGHQKHEVFEEKVN